MKIVLSTADLAMLCEALDGYEYWELGAELPRNNGAVFIPGDAIGTDPYWGHRNPDAQQRAAIEMVRQCRHLGARLTDMRNSARRGSD